MANAVWGKHPPTVIAKNPLEAKEAAVIGRQPDLGQCSEQGSAAGLGYPNLGPERRTRFLDCVSTPILADPCVLIIANLKIQIV